MSWFDNLRSIGASIVRAPKTQPVVDGSRMLMGKLGGARSLSPYPKANADMLRRWARKNEFLRTAINRRKHQIGQAQWRLVRRDKPNDPPDAAVENTVRDLFDQVNSKDESFRSLMDQVVEDVLILDAGCIEKEKTLGGKIAHLWAVNGATILPDPNWDGSDQNAPRYYQLLPGADPIALRNDQLIYIMGNPSTHSNVGWSPVETLVNIIRAELFGEDYNYEMIRRSAPRGLLHLGDGISTEEREGFREYWSSEIEGLEATAITSSPAGSKGPAWIPLTVDDFEKRLAYMKWLATKIAAVFEMDLLVFNLSDTVHKSVGKALTSRTDEGANALARLVAEFITREIIWEIDPTRNHRFEFDDLNDRDALAQAQIDQIRMQIGVTFPNELRTRDGLDPVDWGDEPWPDQTTAMLDEGDGTTDDELGESDDPGKKKSRSAASDVPFAGASTSTARRSSTRRSTRSWHARRTASTTSSTDTSAS